MTASRITAGRVRRLSDQLGLRDLEVIRTLDRVRLATTRQLERLHFREGTPLSNARSCRSTLTRLSRLGVLARLERRVGGVRAGSAGFLYSLDVAGQRLAGRNGVGRGARYQTPWTPSNPFIDHRLAVTELYVRMVEATRQGAEELLAFEAEPDSWRSFTGPGGEAVRVKPDAFVRVAGGDYTDHVFVEVDLATESRRALSLKLDRYREYWASGVEQRRHGVFPRVAWLVPNRARYDVLVDLCARQPAEAWELFQVAESADAVHALLGGSDE